ncbi:MAG: hypothetical protein HQL12_08880 [Candidatus Omnitrophica bacterium]|nr:hypothetical protein [Candidatus Omnitrophota bacterium]
MNCKKAQESILTDYIDARIEDKQKNLIDQHLIYCRTCKNFLISIKKEVINPFISVPRVVPDESLWTRIKQTIEVEELQQVKLALVPGFWERWKSAVHIPRPAFALATIVTMVFMISSTGQLFFSGPVVKINGQDQVEYLSSLIDESVVMNISNDSRTPIEKYFL